MNMDFQICSILFIFHIKHIETFKNEYCIPDLFDIGMFHMKHIKILKDEYGIPDLFYICMFHMKHIEVYIVFRIYSNKFVFLHETF